MAKCHRALEHYDLALEMQRELEDEYAALGEVSGFVFEEIGECLLRKGALDAARPYFAKAYEELCKDQWLTNDEPKRLERLRELGGG